MNNKKRSRRSRTSKTNIFKTFFNKIFIISLYDQVKKFEKVEKQFKNRGIKVDRFIAIDGRCKKEGDKACKDKLNSFEISYGVTISNKNKLPLKELIPASSLTIGTLLLLRKMVKEKWKHILICEDDIELTQSFNEKFNKGLKEIGDYKWDILYLGCGDSCGIKGISEEKTIENKYMSEVGEIYDWEYYVSNKNDLRRPCDNCKEFSEHISIPETAGGTWCYAYSLSGAKKILKLIDNDVGNHIDQILKHNMGPKNKIKALAFDPPIVYHEHIISREGSNIPWSW